mmetsp:Transcript_32931/g.77091  ORF Transcript_32931/g.77091 Transcript_32931/m.77091 type:complete len:107 (-) Transcript_32931:130-450(-)
MDAPVGTWFYARDDGIGCDIIREGNTVLYKEGDKQYKNSDTGEFFFANERTVKLDYKQDDAGMGWWQSTAEGGLRLRKLGDGVLVQRLKGRGNWSTPTLLAKRVDK